MLLLPTEELNRIVLGVLGRALSMYDVALHGFAFMSNHFRLLVTPANAQQLAEFVGYLKSQISRKAGELYDWKGTLWDERYTAITVLDEPAQVYKMRYILAHGAMEGLVVSPLQWPGVHCAGSLVRGDELVGIWLDRTALYEATRRARRKGETVDENDYKIEYPIHLTVLPCWDNLSTKEYQRRCMEMVAEIEREAKAENQRLSRDVMDIHELLELNPHDIPPKPNRAGMKSEESARPMVHASTKRARKAFLAGYYRFVEKFRKASKRLRNGERNVEFPLYSFPPRLPFVGGTMMAI